jgi:hypothetical protein
MTRRSSLPRFESGIIGSSTPTLQCSEQFAISFERWALTEALQARGIPLHHCRQWPIWGECASGGATVLSRFYPALGTTDTTGPLFRASAASLRIRRPAPLGQR